MKDLEIFKLEGRILFEAAAAAYRALHGSPFARADLAVAASSGTCSTRVFQLPQLAHWPVHLP